MMIPLTIDNQKVQVPAGATLLDAARSLGIHIPTLCFAAGYKPSTSCMVCVVRVEGFKSLVPACGTRAVGNMVVTTCDDGIKKARKTAIELLLSDHVGDCVGPCERGCPANMNIPLMIRQIAAGKFEDAIRTVKKDIPLPAVLGRICPAPCEKVCRRAQADGAVSIRLLKRFVADVDLQSDNPYRPECLQSIGKKVAIVGAGPCGLSAGYYLRQAGIECTIFDDHEYPGGSLRYGSIDQNILPLEVVEKEIDPIMSLGIIFKGNIRVTQGVSMEELKRRYDAILLAVGELSDGQAEKIGIETKDNKIQVTRPEYYTSRNAVFAAGGCIGSRNLMIRAVADGKEAANAIQSYVLGQENSVNRQYNHPMGRLEKQELELFLKQSSNFGRIEPNSEILGLTAGQAQDESRRCLHCDCRKADSCQLRDAATGLAARRNVWPNQRKLFEQITACEKIIFEPGKCIKCGLCVQTSKNAGEQIGLSFEGRGFEMKIVAPLEKTLTEGLQKVSMDCVKICPTGALSLNEMIE
ncbi:MAG: (2Fe-2S)-binding protein [Phycisphaerae bacterium]|nr:(2Fe-2S)-binding protein [Phycisphaerae bacterium]